MAKVLIAYDTKYGNTQRVAELVAEGLNEEGTDTSVENMKRVDFNSVDKFDAILIGSPNHVGRPTRTFHKFVGKLRKRPLKGKLIVAFDTYVENEFEKAMKKMEETLQEKLAEIKLLTPGLSIKVEGMKGPIVESELSKCKEFGHKIASQL